MPKKKEMLNYFFGGKLNREEFKYSWTRDSRTLRQRVASRVVCLFALGVAGWRWHEAYIWKKWGDAAATGHSLVPDALIFTAIALLICLICSLSSKPRK